MYYEIFDNIFVFGIVFDWVRIDGDEDAPDARDKRQRVAVGTPGIMGRRIARNGRHRHSHEILSFCLALEVPRNAAKIKWNLTADLLPPFFYELWPNRT